LREGQQRAKKVAGSEAEAVEVAGGGSKGQRKSPEQRQRPSKLQEGAARTTKVAGAEAPAVAAAARRVAWLVPRMPKPVPHVSYIYLLNLIYPSAKINKTNIGYYFEEKNSTEQ
jgi:hypothetical protein